MRLDWLQLTDVRAYQSLEVRPDPEVNVLVGDNGAGKTTVLEAIGYLASMKSFRRAPDASLICDGAETAVIRGEFSKGEIRVRVEVEIPRTGRRRVLVNGKRPSTMASVAGEIPLVTFLPDDLDLIKRGPAYRREYLDDLVVSLRPAVAVDLQGYERAVRQRNALLRRDGRYADTMTLDVLDQRIAELGAIVLGLRLDLLERLGPVLSGLYAVLGDGPEQVAWIYERSHGGPIVGVSPRPDLGADLAAALAAARQTDLDRRTTTVGPHRDEIVLTLANRDVRTRASQGEQRSVALGLRVAAYDLLRERGDVPVLVLDDVFSELDEGRSRRLVDRLPEGQVFVSSAREDEVPVRGRRWQVTAGSITGVGEES